MAWTDPDFSSINSHAAKPGSAASADDTAGQVAGTASKLAGATDGKGPESFAGDASEVGKTLAGLATDAAIATDVWGDLKRAADAWTAAAPKAVELNAAEKAVTDAQAAANAANKTADAAGATKEDQDAADKAGAALAAAKLKLIDLKRRRDAADKDFLAAVGRAITKAQKITPGREQTSADGGGYGNGKGTDVGNGGTGTGAGNDRPSGAPGTRAVTPSTPAVKTPSTPAAKTPGTAAPSAGAPDTKTSNGTGDLSKLLSQLGQPQQAAQQAQATPTAAPAATTPQQATQPQDGQKKDDGKNPKQDGVFDVDDVDRALGETAPAAAAAGLAGLGAVSAAIPAAVNSTSYRPAGTPIPGTNADGSPATNTAAAPTSGTSKTGLHTSENVSGLPDGTQRRTAFSATPAGAETKLSSADATNATGTRPGATPAGTNPLGGMNPAAMGHALGGAPAHNPQSKSEEKNKILQHESKGYHGEDSIGEAVRGGTIAQNRPGRFDADQPAA